MQEGGDQILDPSIGQTAKGVGGGEEGERKRIQIPQYGCTHTCHLERGDLGPSTKVRRYCGRTAGPLTAHHSNTLTSPTGWGDGGCGGRAGKGTAERFRPRRRSRRQHL